MKHRTVPDVLREREPLSRGRKPQTELSLDLLAGKTKFVTDQSNFGSLYTLAKNHGKKCIVKKTKLNEEVGMLVWFEDIPAQ